MADARDPGPTTALVLVALAMAALMLVLVGVRLDEERPGRPDDRTVEGTDPAREGDRGEPGRGERERGEQEAAPADDGAPRWRQERVFRDGRTLVAYYGTAGTGALGVLGESPPEVAHRRLLRAAAPFRSAGRPVQPVFELIVTIADAHPGADGDYSHDIARADVRRYVAAARRHDALLLLDLQPGRGDFLDAARRWAWALRAPHVGLALDPEWRMGPGQVPAQVIGSVRAAEVNRVSGWLAGLVRRRDLPEKPFVLHQFRTTMLPDIGRISPRPGLALVQHVDGFGTPGQKLATYRTVARPRQFRMGFKLFYDEDTRLLGARDVRRIRPVVRYVSYQ